jgi:rare lipoprotein A
MRFSSVKLLAGVALGMLVIGAPGAETRQEAGNPPLPMARPDDAAYRQVGKASWYGPRFHGKTTASGERFDQNKLTAAHRELPLGTRITVTNLENGKTVRVEINDRGPYKRGRVLDLSKAAARRLGMVDDGVVQVRIEATSLPPRA